MDEWIRIEFVDDVIKTKQKPTKVHDIITDYFMNDECS